MDTSSLPDYAQNSEESMDTSSTPDSSQDREERLRRRRERERARRANETAEQKERRLRQRRERDRARRATQVTEEREARLLQLSASQREREARLQCDRQRHREQVVVQSQLPLFQQHSVRSKMLRFHAHMASLDSPQCTTCSESYPGLRLGSQSTVCQRCTQDKHTHSPSSSRCSTNGG